jgi:release factor glutamine methyltransferase
MTATVTDFPGGIVTADGVYAPQHDSWLLIHALTETGVGVGRHVLDLCTGSGVVGIAAAQQDAAGVTAFDICPRAVRCSRLNAGLAGVEVDLRLGALSQALSAGPFDVVVCNPPYVPACRHAGVEAIAGLVGPPASYNGGEDGRQFLDPLCDRASELLAPGGTMLVVQSVLSGVERSLTSLRSAGLYADYIARQRIPFGPVLSARRSWLERTGRLDPDCHEEEIVVIRADKP